MHQTLNTTSSPNNHQDNTTNTLNKSQKETSSSHEKNVLETYNLTHDNSNGHTLKFDDKNWSKNVSSLKPLVIKFYLERNFLFFIIYILNRVFQFC